MTKINKNINEELSELKNIPSGKEFSDLLTVYKAVSCDPSSFKKGYDRKQADFWNNRGNDSFGQVAYTWLKLSDAIDATGSFGHNVVMFKILGGLDGYVFFDYSYNSDIKNLLIKTYGSVLNLHDQLLKISGNDYVANKYGHYSDSSTFGRNALEALRKDGVFIRGFVCTYWHSDRVVVYPCNFSDLVPCAAARGVYSSMSDDTVKRMFSGFLGDSEREAQQGFVDIVPHLQMVHAFDPDGGQYIRVGGKIYAPYDSKEGPNILIIDDENIIKPKDEKLFPKPIRLDEMPSNISTKGRFYFIMRGFSWEGNVMGIDEDGNQLTEDNSPIFRIKGSGQWFEWQYITWMYENPQWIKENLLSQNVEFVAESIGEAFKQGMSYDEFLKKNGAIGYVCSHSWSIQGILDHGFSREWASENDKNQRGGSWYGIGVYGSPITGDTNVNCDLRNGGASRLSLYHGYDKPDGLKYGGVIFKCVILGGWNNFLIFDKVKAEQVYHQNWRVEDQIQQIIGTKNQKAADYLIQSLKNGSRMQGGPGYFRYEAYENGSNDPRTGDALQGLFRSGVGSPEFEKWESFFRQHGVRGAIYHGGNDGYAFVCYNFSEVIPISVSYDNGRTFTTAPHSWHDSSGNYSVSGINWEKTHDRLSYGGDAENKLGEKYKTVDSFPKKVNVDDTVFGCVSVEKNNGKWNCVRMDTLKELFPIDFDEKPTFAINGNINFVYKGYKFEGKLYNRSVDGATFFYPNREGNEFNISDIDAVIYYYIEGHTEEGGGQQEETYDNEEYQEVPDEQNNQQLQESFFRFLDKMELL